MESQQCPSSVAAREALDDLTRARDHLASRIRSPWWYRAGQAVSVTTFSLGVSVLLADSGQTGRALAVSLIAVGACALPVLLASQLKDSTGVLIERYGAAVFRRWAVACTALLAVGAAMQVALHLPYALAGAGLAAGISTLVMEHQVDVVLRNQIRGMR